MPAFLDTLGLHGLGLSAPYDSGLSTPQGIGISTPSQVNLHALVGQHGNPTAQTDGAFAYDQPLACLNPYVNNATVEPLASNGAFVNQNGASLIDPNSSCTNLNLLINGGFGEATLTTPSSFMPS